MLRVDVRDLRHGPVETAGAIASDDAALEGLGIELTGPLEVEGRLQVTGQGEYFWRGRLTGEVRGECRRCLTPLTLPVAAEVGVMFSADPESQDDPEVYALAPTASAIDLTQAVREELALAVQAYPLCREDCAGLCPRCGADLNAGPCACAPSPDNT
ncbi:MAG TPA: DUF177 domain-containing protein [Gemmatimonadales bacterium]|nr:DUF177 domain-containing protein [Gemmatimonadales bacterium]